MRFTTAIILISTLLPFAAATYTTNSKSCGQNEFWWSDKDCCLPKGGPPSPPTPPKGSDCPPTSYYWGDKQGCCVPRNPPPTNAPEPQCRKNWSWRPGMRQCLPAPTPTTTYSVPSQTPGGDKGHGGRGGYHKREFKSRATSLCPTGLDACPIKGLNTSDYECLDTDSELESCGGCTSLGKGQDCTTIPGAWNVGCDRGSCIVYSCAGGFVLSLDGKSCIEL